MNKSTVIYKTVFSNLKLHLSVAAAALTQSAALLSCEISDTADFTCCSLHVKRTSESEWHCDFSVIEILV